MDYQDCQDLLLLHTYQLVVVVLLLFRVACTCVHSLTGIICSQLFVVHTTVENAIGIGITKIRIQTVAHKNADAIIL